MVPEHDDHNLCKQTLGTRGGIGDENSLDEETEFFLFLQQLSNSSSSNYTDPFNSTDSSNSTAPEPQPPSTTENGGLSKGAIAGIVVGSVLGAITLVGIASASLGKKPFMNLLPVSQ